MKTPEQALAYITDCTLATACSLAMKKKRSKYEFERQISIAQTAIDWMIEMSVNFDGTRAEKVMNFGSVQSWANQYLPK